MGFPAGTFASVTVHRSWGRFGQAVVGRCPSHRILGHLMPIRRYLPALQTLLPLCIERAISPNHKVRVFGAWVDTFDFGSGIFGLRGCYRTGSPPFESAMRRKLCHYAHDWRALGALSLERKPNASSSGLGSSGSSANAPCQTGQECYQSSARARAPPPDRGVRRSETLAPSSAPCTSTSIPAGNAEGALLFAGRRSKRGRRTARGPVCQPLLQQPVLCQQPFRLHSSTFAHVPFDLVGQALAGTSRARASIVTVRPRSLEFVAWVAPLQAAESCRHGGRMSGRVRHRLAGFRISRIPISRCHPKALAFPGGTRPDIATSVLPGPTRGVFECAVSTVFRLQQEQAPAVASPPLLPPTRSWPGSEPGN